MQIVEANEQLVRAAALRCSIDYDNRAPIVEKGGESCESSFWVPASKERSSAFDWRALVMM